MTGQIIGSSSAAVTRYTQEISSLFTSSLARVHDSNKDFHSKFVTSAYYACYYGAANAQYSRDLFVVMRTI